MNDDVTFDQLGLSSEILRAINDEGYTNPTLIQSQVIPLVLTGQDVMASAQTGTGKTAGFALPLLHRLQPYANSSMSPARHLVRALIMAPTRELAIQIHESVSRYSKYLSLRCTAIYGGVDMNSQITALQAGVEILVATPGRLLDHLNQKTVNLSRTEVLVLDEADRMLDMGFLPDIRRIMALLSPQRQNLMFSATFSNDIRKLADTFMNQPKRVEVAGQNTVNKSISHIVHPVKKASKFKLLVHLIRHQGLKQVLVFIKTRHGASQLAQMLTRSKISALAIHGDKNQQQRTQALTEFKQGNVRVLVATDVAARGLDIEKLSHVVNYELPGNPEDYVHRIGRTGRAGCEGKAISLVSDHETELLTNIEKFLKTTLKIEQISGFDSEISSQEPVKKRKTSSKSGWHSQDKSGDSFITKKEKHHSTTKRSTPYRKISQKSQDPIFTHPYVPQSSEKLQSIDREAHIFSRAFRQARKVVPALLSAPIKNEMEQSIEQ